MGKHSFMWERLLVLYMFDHRKDGTDVSSLSRHCSTGQLAKILVCGKGRIAGGAIRVTVLVTIPIASNGPA